MFMDKRFRYFVLVSALCSVDASFEFLYQENHNGTTSDVTRSNVTLNGSHVNIGNWPHWCLGNISKCTNGLMVDLWIRFAKVAENASDVIIFTTGGHTWYSNGVYLLQRYGDQYELGVVYFNHIWTVEFRLLSGLWANIRFTWDSITGLTVLVDGTTYNAINAADRGDFQLLLDTFMNVEMGLNLDGTQMIEESRYEIAKLSVYNWIDTKTENDTDNMLLWLGCGLFNSSDFTSVSAFTAVFDCRSICSTKMISIAAIKNNTQCACTKLDNLNFINKHKQTCMPATDWDFYSASAIAYDDFNYSIVVTVIKLGKKDYVKSMESVLISINTNFNIAVPFTIEFDDDTTMNSTEKQISYSWMKGGTYNITVTARVGIFSVIGRAEFTITDVDEGYAGDFVMLNTFYSNRSRFANVDVISIDYAVGTCALKYGELNVTDVILANLTNYVDNNYQSHLYSDIGRYNLSVDCRNPYGTIRNYTNFTSRKLETTHHFIETNTSFVTDVTGDKDFVSKVKIQHNDPNVKIILNQMNFSKLIIEPKFLRIQENFLTYEFDNITVDKRIVIVQNIVSKPELFSAMVDGSWKLVTNVTVRVFPGNNMFLNVSFGSGEDQTFFIHYLTQQTDVVFEIMFEALGYYTMQASISNDISYNTSDILVSVEVPLQDITLRIVNFTNTDRHVELLIDLNLGNQGPQKVNFEIDHGDGIVQTYHHFNYQFIFSTYCHMYVYSDWGIYNICVRAYNKISTIRECLTVQIGQNITYIDITIPSAGRVKVNETVNVVVRCPSGSDRKYIVAFGDGETFVFTDQYLIEAESLQSATISILSTTNTTYSIDSTKLSSGNRRRRQTNDTAVDVVTLDATTFYVSTESTATSSTTVQIPSTIQSIPHDATDPFTTNTSLVQRLSAATISISHRYQYSGTYIMKTQVLNHFNWAQDILCPQIIVADTKNDGCQPPELVIASKFASSFQNPMNFFRSEQINLTADVKLTGCGSDVPTYSWKTETLVEEDNVLIRRPYHDTGICLLQETDNIFRYRKSSLPFGMYVATLVVSPANHPLLVTMHEFYIAVNPSPPIAVIEGASERLWFLVYATTMIKFQRSIDPDFDTYNGIVYDLVCMAETDLKTVLMKTREVIIESSKKVVESVTFKYTTKNPVRLYEFSTCFTESDNLTHDIRFPMGQFEIPSEYFVSNVNSFAVVLYVTKNNMTTSASVTFEIRLSNSSSLMDQLDELLKSKDTTGVMRAVSVLSATLLTTTSTNTSENNAFEENAKVTEIKTKLIGALDSVSNGVKDIDQASGMLDLVGDLTKDTTSVSDSARVGATSAIKNSAAVTESFADASFDSLTDVGAKVVLGISNVLPKEDPIAKQVAEHEKAVAQAQTDTVSATGTSEINSPNAVQTDIVLNNGSEGTTVLTAEDLTSSEPLPYNKLLAKCDLQHSDPLDKLYQYIFFYESIFRVILKTKSQEINVSADILLLPRNDIFCYIGVLEEPGDIEWHYNRFFDEEKRYRDLIRRNADRDVNQHFLGAIDSVSSVLLNKTDTNQTVELIAPGLKVAMKRGSANDSEGSNEMRSTVETGVKMPTSVMAAVGNDSEIGQTVIVNAQSPFTYGNENSATSIGTSVVTFKLSTPGTKNQVPVSNTSEPIEIFLAGDPSKVQEPQLYILLLSKGDSKSTMNYHSINVTKNDTTLHFIVRPQHSDSTDLFDVLIQYEDYPNETHYLAMTTLPQMETKIAPNLTWEHTDVIRHTFFPDAKLTSKAGIYKVGVRLRSGKIDFEQQQTMFNYTWQMFLASCRFWNPQNETWDNEGCAVGNLTTFNYTQCLCTHLTSFGGEMVVPPNTIDFNNVWAKFKNLNENAAVFATIITLLCLYVIGIIWARHMDKKDLIKWGATSLEDNLPTDSYHYQITVYTGIKKHAGTKSNISIIISGEEHDTGVRRLFDGKRTTHETGSTLNYILSVENKLGPLNFCRIWHDNSGAGNYRSWFLDQIEVSDLQTGERYYFLCKRWLACEEDDGMVDRIIPVAGIEDLIAFQQLFSSSIRKKLTSDHLWFSVFSRPTRSKFTRIQRISCCISLLFLTMITNAMWFKSDTQNTNTQQTVAMKIGPISFTLQQIFISLASTIIVFPPSFLLITLFRRTKETKNTVAQINMRQPKRKKWKNVAIISRYNMEWDEEPKPARLTSIKNRICNCLRGSKIKSKYSADDEDEFEKIPVPVIAGDPNAKKIAQKKRKKPFMFPFWFNYIAWILCFLSIIVPAFFTILYSMQWGKDKANEWLTTFVLSFFQSVIVVQPLKVMCMVAFIACVLKRPDIEEDGDYSNVLANAIAVHEDEVNAKSSETIDEIAKRRRLANEKIEAPDPVALEEARLARLKEIKMEEILKEMMVYGFFIAVLFFLSYQQRDEQSFLYTNNLRNMFAGDEFQSVSTVSGYWDWLQQSFLPTLYVAQYNNGTDLVNWWDKRCLVDFESRRMGIARMRQFRIKEDTCTVLGIMKTEINHCRNDYNWVDDDTMSYFPGWIQPSEKNRTILDERTDDPYVYQSSFRLQNVPYVAVLQTYKGGGYVVNFERSYRRTLNNITRLREENWLDLRTRAVFLEFTVYNPNSNLFASAILVTEFPSFGSAIPRNEFKIFRLQGTAGGFAIVVIFFQVLYCCYTFYFFIRCIKKVKIEKCKYLNSFWNMLEFCMLCFAVACIAMYVLKYTLTEVAFHYLKKQSQPEFINFQSLALYDEFYGYMAAIVVFLASIQFLKLLQFNKKMNMLGETVALATKDLKVFSVAFLIYFLTFVITAYLLFGKYMDSFKSMFQSIESMFGFTLGAFDFQGLSDAHKFLGPIFFFTFVMVIFIGMMSMFLTIIGEAFSTVKEATNNAQNEYEMVDFIWRKVKGILGVK